MKQKGMVGIEKRKEVVEMDVVERLDERNRLYTIYRLRGYSEEVASDMSLRDLKKRLLEGLEKQYGMLTPI